MSQFEKDNVLETSHSNLEPKSHATHQHEEEHHHLDCECGHQHHHTEAAHPTEESFHTSGIKLTCLVEHLSCANCASKMETRIAKLPGVNSAVLTFATKQLRVSITPQAAQNQSALIQKFQDVCASIEPDVVVTNRLISQKGKKLLQTPEHSGAARKKLSDNQISLFSIIAGALLLVGGKILESYGLDSALLFPLYIAAYLILGGRIVMTAIKNLGKGQIFDENFLMSIATLGAFVIGDYPEAVGVMLFYRVGEFFEEAAVARSRSQIMNAVDLRPEVVSLVLGNDTSTIPAEDAKKNDILLVRPGDRIPLDGTIIDGESRLDTSPITGEPVPVKVSAGDSVTSGCINTSGQLKIRVEKVLEDSMVTRILDSVENAAASKPQIDKFITRFSRVYTPIVVFAALATAIIPSLITGNWSHWVYTALTFLVISCPCALVLSVPLAFFSGIGAGSKKGILFKGGVSIEALNHVTNVVMDKTGTITKGNFVVQKIVSLNNSGDSIQNQTKSSLAEFSQEDVLLLCANAEQFSTHPIAASIVTAAKEKGFLLTPPTSLEEIAGHGIKAVLAEGEILVGNQKLMKQFGVDLSSYLNEDFGTEVLLAVDGCLAGYLVISDTIKPEAASAISSLKKMQITTAMLTGDAVESAQSVASETGIEEVYAKLLPEDKLKELQHIRKKSGSVMFVGDGINDAPVLAGADVGAAMGSGADAAIEAADVVFMTSNMEAIPQSISIARATTRIAWQNVTFALAIKALVMILGLAGYASMWMAVFADSGVAMLCVLNSIRILYKK